MAPLVCVRLGCMHIIGPPYNRHSMQHASPMHIPCKHPPCMQPSALTTLSPMRYTMVLLMTMTSQASSALIMSVPVVARAMRLTGSGSDWERWYADERQLSSQNSSSSPASPAGMHVSAWRGGFEWCEWWRMCKGMSTGPRGLFDAQCTLHACFREE
jgi:hypothetical protein